MRDIAHVVDVDTQQRAGFNVSQVVAPEYVEEAQRMITEKLAGNTTANYELEIIAKDGQRVSLELSTRLIN